MSDPDYLAEIDADETGGEGGYAAPPPVLPRVRVDHERSPLPFYERRGDLYEHQTATLEASWDKPAWGWFLDMGTGKTRVAIDNIALLALHRGVTRVIVLCPKTLVSNWVDREIPEHGSPGVRWRIIRWRPGKKCEEEIRAPAAAGRVDVLVMNVEALSGGLQTTALASVFLRGAAGRSMLIIDESTTVKSPSARRTKRALQLAGVADYRRILTGSPVTRSPLDLYSQMQVLDWKILGHKSFWTFRSRYAVMRPVVFGGRTVQTVVGHQNLTELATKVAKFSTRILKSECLDLPPKTWERRSVEMTDEQKAIYKQIKQTASAVLESGEHVTATEVITQILRLHQVACGHVRDEEGLVHSIPHRRVDALLQTIEEIPPEGKIIIWSNYVHCILEAAAALAKEHGPASVATLYGATADSARKEAVDRIQKDPATRFLVANPATGGWGLTLTAADTAVFYSNGWDLEQRAQAEDRIHRIGQTRPVTYVDLVVEGTVDERILQALRKKIDLAAEVMRDGPRPWLS